MSDFAIIVAGGLGKRMGQQIPKQFLSLAGKPLLQYSLEAFRTAIPEIRIVLVIPPAFVEKAKDIILACGMENHTDLVMAGKQRFHSVRNGLDLIPEGSARIAVHDAARPLVSIALIQGCFDALKKAEAVIPLISIHDSVRTIKEGEISQSVDRKSLRAIQTPQCFRSEVLKKSYQLPYDPSFTDDASVVERAGFHIDWVEGDPINLKITSPEDLIIAEALLAGRTLSGR